MSETIYVGSAKAIQSKYGELLSASFGPKDIETLLANRTDKGWVNVRIFKRKSIGRYGETHSIALNDWNPEVSEEPAEQPKAPERKPITIEDLPF